MINKLEGKTAVITGGTEGIGLATARLFVKEGAYVFINDAITQPAWRTKPGWYLISTEDRMIPPDAQRAMSRRAGPTVVEVKGSHPVYVSQPQAVARFIEEAAAGALAAAKEKTAE